MEIQTPMEREKIRMLNDVARQNLCGIVVLTSSVACLDPPLKAEVLTAVRTFQDFDADNDPHEEHDMAFLTVGRLRCFFKWDYYDKSMEMASPDPSNPAITKRVLTIGLAADW